MLRFQRLRDDKCIQAMFNFSKETVVVPEAEIEQSIIWVGEGDSSEEFDGVLPPFSGALYYASTQHA